MGLLKFDDERFEPSGEANPPQGLIDRVPAEDWLARF